MAISKLILNGEVQMDVTQDTVAPENLFSGETATGADGEPVVGEYAVPTGTKQITENGTGIDVAAYAAVDVNVSGGGGSFATGTYTPAERLDDTVINTGLSSVTFFTIVATGQIDLSTGYGFAAALILVGNTWYNSQSGQSGTGVQASVTGSVSPTITNQSLGVSDNTNGVITLSIGGTLGNSSRCLQPNCEYTWVAY